MFASERERANDAYAWIDAMAPKLREASRGLVTAGEGARVCRGGIPSGQYRRRRCPIAFRLEPLVNRRSPVYARPIVRPRGVPDARI